MTPLALSNYRLAKVREEREVPQGLDSFSWTLQGYWQRSRFARLPSLEENVPLIQTEMERYRTKSDQKISEIAQVSAMQLLHKNATDAPIITGLACVALATQRTLGINPHPVQLQAACAIFKGCLAEMATGEGKTLAIGLAAVLMGLTRLPCHILTANEYLAHRDATELSPLYQFFGLHVSSVTGQLTPPARREAYRKEIVYTTAKEILADFLRDRLKTERPFHSTRELIRHLAGFSTRSDTLVMRGMHFAILDEADSLLIDESITPLIISQSTRDPQLVEALKAAFKVTEKLEPKTHYEINYRFRDVYILPQVWSQLTPEVSQFPPWWRGTERFREVIRTTLLVREFYHRDIQYTVQNGKIEIIDESTGRVMLHRTWQQGIHQAIEVKEGLKLTDSTQSLASLSFQRYFRCYPRLAGLSGTVAEVASEVWHYYQMPLIKIPTHRPVQRILLPTQFYLTKREKWMALVVHIREIRAQGRPILIGTRSVQSSEELADILQTEQIPFVLLNANRDENEASIIAQAGQDSRVTIATNMAGRGTDIKLGPGVAEKGGLHVIVTERNAFRRVDRQLLGRAGRQGDPGSGIFITSLEDDLCQKYCPGWLRDWVRLHALTPKNLNRWEPVLAFIIQRSAEMEARRERRLTVENDTWLDEHLTYGGRTTLV